MIFVKIFYRRAVFHHRHAQVAGKDVGGFGGAPQFKLVAEIIGGATACLGFFGSFGLPVIDNIGGAVAGGQGRTKARRYY
jgi:hypothetical protein